MYAHGSVTFTSDPAKELEKFVGSCHYSQVGLLVDSNTARACYPIVRNLFDPERVVEVLAGEECKNLLTCEAIWSRLTQMKFDRTSLLVILGGGVLGDMGGFCAATYKRGIDFVLVPTTVLAQADASIGGKLGIDFEGYKNQLGVFQAPHHTFISTLFLRTLPTEEFLSGFAEIIKHSLLSSPANWNDISKSAPVTLALDKLLKHSVEFKLAVTTEDPLEKGRRKILNLGHTLGHAIETWFLKQGRPIRHGMAVAAGLVMEVWLSAELLGFPCKDLDIITRYVLTYYGKLPTLPEPGQIVRLTGQDKKNVGGSARYSLLKEIGNPVWDQRVSENDAEKALAWYVGLQI